MKHIWICLLIPGLAIVVTSLAWAWNNPLGNQVTYFKHFGDALMFKALPQYQAKD